MLECVVNISEGRRADVLAALAGACATCLLDVHADADHHRSVFTLAGSPPAVEAAALRLAHCAATHLDIAAHSGVHPRLGALDVVPFVALAGTDPEVAAAAARRFAAAVAAELALPAFFYDDADPAGRTLPETRRTAWTSRRPDLGPAEPHPALGAVAVGARAPLVAVNCELGSDDVALAVDIARTVRERDGGLPGVRALGFALPRRGRAQVSMNLVSLEATGLQAAVEAVRRAAREQGSRVTALELVGLLPASELARCSEVFLAWAGLGPESTIEARLGAVRTPPSAGYG
ncbi:MAG: glutamate formimidoyltransferase [Acidimicrobiia bacterium]